MSGGAHRTGAWLVIIVPCAAVLAVTSGFTVGGSRPGPWVDDTVLSPGGAASSSSDGRPSRPTPPT